MAKSRNDRWKAEQREKLAAQRIWPTWARTIAAMIEAEAIVRFACPACKRLYDVDLEAIAMMRGRAWSLIGRAARCKASKCRDRGFFVAAWRHDVAFTCLSGDDMPRWLVGARPSDHEPPPEGPGGVPPCPKGVDAVRWAYADERERKRMVREVRG